MLDREFENIQIIRDRSAGCVALIAIHDTRLGPAFGGIRRSSYRSVDEAFDDVWRLARAMTLKCAVAGIPAGGGKTVIIQHAGLDRRAAYRLVGRQVASLGGRYYTGPDVGTTAEDLDEVAQETQYVATESAGGPGPLSEPTALGVCAGITAVAERLGFADLRGVVVAVQGLGQVGYRLAEMLAHAGAELIVADVRGEIAERAKLELGAQVMPGEEILGARCDILAPCALGGVVNVMSIDALRARAVAGSANNVLADPACGVALARRGILYAPDFVINAGALIHGALFHLEGTAPPAERVTAIGGIVGDILDRARAQGTPPEVLAEQVAMARVAAATEAM